MEILFRGKRASDSKIVYGGAVRVGSSYYIVTSDYVGKFHHDLVLADTLQQYTNVKDSDFTKIFLGDIVKVVEVYNDGTREWVGKVGFTDGAFAVFKTKDNFEDVYMATLGTLRKLCDIYVVDGNSSNKRVSDTCDNKELK